MDTTIRESTEWRRLPDEGAALILKELNGTIDALEFGTISLPVEGALDFWFGERVFRVVFRPGTPKWALGCRVHAQDVSSVLCRRVPPVAG